MTLRKSRGDFIRIALVGYTNAGKSTVMNLLTGSRVTAQDKLFATLDTTVRKLVINKKKYLLADTVGFIHKLPHTLIESFKATLDEVREADILLHVIDFSNKYYEHQISVVEKTLYEIGAGNKRVIYVFNKIDKLEEYSDKDNNNMKITNKNNNIFISAIKKTNIEELKNLIYKMSAVS
jgi:GTP-binding protein HflX